MEVDIESWNPGVVSGFTMGTPVIRHIYKIKIHGGIVYHQLILKLGEAWRTSIQSHILERKAILRCYLGNVATLHVLAKLAKITIHSNLNPHFHTHTHTHLSHGNVHDCSPKNKNQWSPE